MEEVGIWIKIAKDDLDSAESNIKSGKHYVSAFLSQQAVEKALKALLLKNQKIIIRIHDLVILGRKVNLPKDLLNKCEELSRVYIETRYGAANGIPSQKFKKEDSLKYFSIAKEVLSWVEKNI